MCPRGWPSSLGPPAATYAATSAAPAASVAAPAPEMPTSGRGRPHAAGRPRPSGRGAPRSAPGPPGPLGPGLRPRRARRGGSRLGAALQNVPRVRDAPPGRHRPPGRGWRPAALTGGRRGRRPSRWPLAESPPSAPSLPPGAQGPRGGSGVPGVPPALAPTAAPRGVRALGRQGLARPHEGGGTSALLGARSPPGPD